MDLAGHHQQDGAQRRLVQGGKDDARDDQRDLDCPDPVQRHCHVETLEYCRAEFQSQDSGVKQYTPSDFEQGRVRIPVDDHVPYAPRLSKIHQQSDNDHQVAEESGQDG